MGGRPPIDPDLRQLIRARSLANPLRGAPRIHGELLKLGFAVTQSTVAKYMVARGDRPAQTWRTFLMRVLEEALLRRVQGSYARYDSESRTHLELGKATPKSRPIERTGAIVARPILGGLHHQYARI